MPGLTATRVAYQSDEVWRSLTRTHGYETRIDLAVCISRGTPALGRTRELSRLAYGTHSMCHQQGPIIRRRENDGE